MNNRPNDTPDQADAAQQLREVLSTHFTVEQMRTALQRHWENQIHDLDQSELREILVDIGISGFIGYDTMTKEEAINQLLDVWMSSNEEENEEENEEGNEEENEEGNEEGWDQFVQWITDCND